MLANVADAEDITQDVLLRVVCKLNTFRGESAFTTWLHRVTVNVVLLHQRKRASCREQRAEDCLGSAGADDCPEAQARPRSGGPDEEALTVELRGLLEEATAGLPQHYREVFVLSAVEGLSNLEIGRRLGIGLAAVKSRLHRARQMMRNALAGYFEEAGP
jgi:RNA polymerase sigma-70 factor (ECF subfamily)